MSEPVRITGIAAGGDGVGKLADGRTVFVPEPRRVMSRHSTSFSSTDDSPGLACRN